MKVFNKTAEISLIVGARKVIQYIIINIFPAPWPSTLTGTVRYHFVEAIDLIDRVAPVRLKCVGWWRHFVLYKKG